MRFLHVLYIGVPAVCAVSCSSSSPPPVESQLQLSVVTTKAGSGALPCDSQLSGIFLDGTTLHVFCNRAIGPNTSTTIANVIVPGFHGADTYSVQGSSDPMAGEVAFDWGGYSWSSVPASAGIQATTCSVTISAPAAPQRGDAVSGTFHCDAMLGIADTSDGGYQAQPTTSADGTWIGFVSF